MEFSDSEEPIESEIVIKQEPLEQEIVIKEEPLEPDIVIKEEPLEPDIVIKEEPIEDNFFNTRSTAGSSLSLKIIHSESIAENDPLDI